MRTYELVNKIVSRKKQLNITIENLAKLSGVGVRTLNRLLAGDDVKLSTVAKVTNLLGLDFAGNEELYIKQLQRKRAKQKAILITSLVQGTSALEKQGLEEKDTKSMIASIENEFLNGNCRDKLWVA